MILYINDADRNNNRRYSLRTVMNTSQLQHNTDENAMSRTMMNDSNDMSNDDNSHDHCDSCTSDTLVTEILMRLK